MIIPKFTYRGNGLVEVTESEAKASDNLLMEGLQANRR